MDPNLRNLPVSVKPLVEADSQEYVVKGDGPCFARTTAAHVYGDEDKGIELAMDLNTHLAEYRDYYEMKISADFSLKVTIGVKGESKVFQNSNEYFNWLQESKKAAYMWRTCVDVIAMSNMAKMDIDISVHQEGNKPELVKFKPDPELPWTEEDTN